jgi:hypothetical protein
MLEKRLCYQNSLSTLQQLPIASVVSKAQRLYSDKNLLAFEGMITVDELNTRFISRPRIYSCGFPMPINIKGKVENANLFSP